MVGCDVSSRKLYIRAELSQTTVERRGSALVHEAG